MTSPSPLRNDNPDQMKIIYDGECPFCASYVGMLRLRENIKDIQLIDARDAAQSVQAMQERGMDINDGMLVIYKDEIYYGPDAMNILSLLTSENAFFNRVIAFFFRSKWSSRTLYPVCRFFRNIALAVLGRKKIETAGQ